MDTLSPALCLMQVYFPTGIYYVVLIHRSLLPPVLWSSLVQSVTIGFVVAVTSNIAKSYSVAYGFEPW